MHNVYLSLGSNIGDSRQILLDAISSIAHLPACNLIAVSSFYLTSPVGGVKQADFTNCCAKLQTTLAPHELLKELQLIELNAGRTRELRWGPRTLDIDILLFGEIEMSDENLTLPHERIFERAFVLIPLLEILDDEKIEFREKVEQALIDLRATQKVVKL